MNIEINEYRKADNNGRELFKTFCSTQSWCKVIAESKDDFAHWDISYYSGGTKIIGEIKVRNYDSKAFLDWDYEEKKHNNLLTVYHQVKAKPTNKNKNIEIQYINFFNDDAIKIWTTTNTHNEQQPIIKNLQVSDVEDKGNMNKGIYKCNLSNEAFRGSITPIQFNEPVEDDNEDDGLPF
ncbi:hypothetical protein [Flavobacterium muglaense]|uniref:Uncharacterized protein n=1 Tax=Flavobacterium muglaense TaxID=2764716 RepID=A0A923N024_9FLAO|nr:hypothetical protein [Flavobacterium muglaense]MBC5836802.1 hypothetical protein [Flavobacterium muglaense]MBC5843248.1 hypothetical protein [Flavobacterium muglaense]